VLLGNIHPALQSSVLDQVERPKLVAADTMNFWISGEPEALGALLKRIDLLIINDEEARDLSGTSNILKAAAEIRKRGPSKLIIKRGEFGALLFDEEGIFFAPAYPLEQVLDPTGAGDSFAGGLMGAIASQGEVTPQGLRRAMLFASAMGSFCVEDIGPTRLQKISRDDLASRVEGFRRMVDFGGALTLPE
jgi:sugar/nucleoside kinase (ribokinase family)